MSNSHPSKSCVNAKDLPRRWSAPMPLMTPQKAAQCGEEPHHEWPFTGRKVMFRESASEPVGNAVAKRPFSAGHERNRRRPPGARWIVKP